MELPKRKPNRLKNWDYSQPGSYFITVCTHGKRKLFGHVACTAQTVGAIHESPAVECILSETGQIAKSELINTADRFPNVEIENYVIMPNHIHLILTIKSDERAIRESPLHGRSEVSKSIGYFKMNVSKRVHRTHPDMKVWQRSFHDHIIRDEQDYILIWEYIDNNPVKWEEDCFYCE